jgi:hypothetical protein
VSDTERAAHVWPLTWRLSATRIEDAWHCPACRRARLSGRERPAKGDYSACPQCLAPLRVGDDCLHKISERGMTRLVYEYPLIAVELLNLIEQYSQAKRAEQPMGGA